jgi:eukaryotic-like serine/threonine-protein kinase
MIGQVIGTYKILDKIGEGGMGVVYKGIDTGLDRLVAIKVLTPEFAHNPELIERFRAEAKAQANLNHQNITTLYAFLQAEGQCLIVMEYIEGETFEDLLVRRGKLPWKEAAFMTRQALNGFGFAHGMGIIHRDIKPSNLMLTKTGAVKIMDFGIAKALGGSTKTRTGLQMGTPQYMSPEQIRGRQVDARSDLYSLGITMYQLLSGDLPFKADSDYELMSAHINTPPPVLTDIHQDVPRGIEQCVRKALAKEPENRFQNAEEFGTALDYASKSPSDLLETKIEFVPTPGFPVQADALARKTMIETATPVRQRTILETPAPRIPTPAPVAVPTPVPAPVAKRKSWLVPILIAAVVGVAIAGGVWWKFAQTPPKVVIINPPNNGGSTNPNGPRAVIAKKEGSTVPTLPKATPTPGPAKAIDKPRTPLANQPQANLVVLCNLDCSWTLDGQPQGSLAAGRPVSVKVPLGVHVVTASSADGADSDDITVNAAAATQTVPARMDLFSKRNQRLQATAQAQAAQAAQQRQQQIQQQIQAQQAAQAQRIQQQQQQQAANAQQLTPAITSPCQIPAMPLIWHNVANNGRYRIRIDCEHADVYEANTNRIVADLVMKKNKYSGTSMLSPCGAGRGRMEILSVNPGRIEARVEIPNVYNHQCTNGVFLAIPNWMSASFIPE